MKIAIVIPCFKRVDTLSTLCDTLLAADYGDDQVTLVFSIDYAEGSSVPSYADDFQWPYGDKIVIKYSENIGLRANILSCGDMTKRYDAVIILEDDLEVMPSFYQFAKSAAEFYEGDDRIAGISIYQYFLDEMTWNMFLPLDEGYDVYFVKWASSWGQLWTRKQWEKFKNWFETHQDISSVEIPVRVRHWTKSWKKYYIAYLTDTNRYYVFPNQSFVYNGNKGNGTHTMKSGTCLTSSPLVISKRRSFSFAKIDEVECKYDSYFQLESREITYNGHTYLVDFDLFGHKEFFHSPYVVTSRKCDKNKIVGSFDAGMLPLELNILKEQHGAVFSLVRREDLSIDSKVPSESYSPIRKTIRNWRQFIPLGIKDFYEEIKQSIEYRLKSIPKKCK